MEKDTLKDDLEDFKLCQDAEADQRKQSLDDLEFALLNKQWDQRDIDQRTSEGRPCLTINRLPAFTKQVTNDARMNRASIHVQAIGNGADKDVADVMSDLIRGIEVRSQSDQVYETAFGFAVNGGVGYFRINVDYACDDEWDQDIFLERIDNPFSVYGDWESKQATSIDWNRCFVTDWYSKAKFEAKFGKGRKATSIEVGSAEWDQSWFADKRVRVAERWFREEVPAKLVKLSNGLIMLDADLERQAELLSAQGVTVVDERDIKTHKVGQRIMNGVEILEENEWLGKYIPIVPMYGEEVNVNGKRHFISLIRRAKDAQRLYNYQRTLSAELGGLQPKAPWMGPVGMFTTDSRWSTANRQSHPYLEYDVVQDQPGAVPQRIQFTPAPPGVMNEALMASDDMKAVMGLFDASLGNQSNETSGRAIMARQREGDAATFDFLDNRNRSVEHGGRIILDLIPRVYTAERIMRCIQEDETNYSVPVNQPVVQEEQLQAIQAGQTVPQKPEDGRPRYVPVPQDAQQQMTPQQQEQLEAVTRIFDLRTGKYDVTVTAGPGFTTRREEAATQMMEFIRVFPQAAGLIGDLLAKNLDWPGAEQVAERLKAMLPQEARGQVDPMVAQLQQMMQAQDAQAKQIVGELQEQIAKMQQDLAQRELELHRKDIQIAKGAFDAQVTQMRTNPEAASMRSEMERAALELRHERELLARDKALFEAQKRIALLEVQKAESSMAHTAQDMQRAAGELDEAAAVAQEPTGVAVIEVSSQMPPMGDKMGGHPMQGM